MVIIVIVVVLLIVLFAFLVNEGKKQLDEIEKHGFLMQNYISMGKYIGGHPELDKPDDYISFYPKDDSFLIFNGASKIKDIATIPKNSIKNISFEDETTITRRVGFKRLLVVGIFAFALKKKQKNEVAYVVIEWNDGRFDHETVFEFEGARSVQKANGARNKIMRNL